MASALGNSSGAHEQAVARRRDSVPPRVQVRHVLRIKLRELLVRGVCEQGRWAQSRKGWQVQGISSPTGLKPARITTLTVTTRRDNTSIRMISEIHLHAFGGHGRMLDFGASRSPKPLLEVSAEALDRCFGHVGKLSQTGPTQIASNRALFKSTCRINRQAKN